MRIGLDINQTLRNLNKKINQVWEKAPEYGKGKPFVDEEDIENHDLKAEIQWNSIQERNAFFFESYAFELFGSAPCMTNQGYTEFDKWVKNAENFRKEPIEFVLYSPFETGLAIKGTMFFCSKFVILREFKFPAKSESIWEDCDVLITANDKIATARTKTEDKTLICIKNPRNQKCQDAADFVYGSLEEMVADLFEYDKLYEAVQAHREGRLVNGKFLLSSVEDTEKNLDENPEKSEE